MVPYASYLRVYEPLGSFDAGARAAVTASSAGGPSRQATLEREQHVSLSRTVSSTAIRSDETAHALDGYLLERDGARFYCPLDMPLRSWISMTRLVESASSAQATIVAPELIAVADDAFMRWRQTHPNAVPHIQQSSWGVPRSWFLSVVGGEKAMYDDGGGPSVRYHARVSDALARVSAAERVLRQVLDDTSVIDEVSALREWLTCFDQSSWIEIDYAGVAVLLSGGLETDESAVEIHRAVEALGRGDIATATASYRRFEERWQAVRAYERAN